MKEIIKASQTSNIHRVFLQDSSSTTGAGLAGLTSASAGLIISTIADVEAAATAYTAAGSTIESITTLGTYAAPTATKCRFKEVDATNHKGIYELQFADARYSVANAKKLLVSISGATNLAPRHFEIQLTSVDLQDGVRAGLTALPNAAAEAAGGLYTRGTGAGQISLSSGLVTLAPVTHTGAVVPTVTTLTNLPAITAGWLTAAGIAAAALNGKGDWPTAAQISTQVWSEAIPGTYGAGSAGYVLGNRLDTAVSSRSTYAGGAVASVTGAVGSVTGNVGGNVAGSVGSVTAGVNATQINGSATAAAQLALSAATIINGAAVAGTLSTTMMTTNLTVAVNDHYKGRIIIWTSGALQNQATDITAYDGATKKLTFTAVTSAPVAGNTFIIV